MEIEPPTKPPAGNLEPFGSAGRQAGAGEIDRRWWLAGSLLAVAALELECPPGHRQFSDFILPDFIVLGVVAAVLLVRWEWVRLLGRLTVLVMAAGALGSRAEILPRGLLGWNISHLLGWDCWTAVAFALAGIYSVITLTHRDFRQLRAAAVLTDPEAETAAAEQRAYLNAIHRRRRFFAWAGAVAGTLAFIAIIALVEWPNAPTEMTSCAMILLWAGLLMASLWAKWDAVRVLGEAGLAAGMLPATMFLFAGGIALIGQGLSGFSDGNRQASPTTLMVIGGGSVLAACGCMVSAVSAYQLLRADMKRIAFNVDPPTADTDPEEAWSNEAGWDEGKPR